MLSVGYNALDCTSSGVWFVLGQRILLSPCLSPVTQVYNLYLCDFNAGSNSATDYMLVASNHFMTTIYNAQLGQNFAASGLFGATKNMIIHVSLNRWLNLHLLPVCTDDIFDMPFLDMLCYLAFIKIVSTMDFFMVATM